MPGSGYYIGSLTFSHLPEVPTAGGLGSRLSEQSSIDLYLNYIFTS